MDAVALDPNGYAGSYKLVGGRPALDFVNTVSWHGTAGEHDWLHDVSNVSRWALAAGLVNDLEGKALARHRRTSSAALGELRAARSDLRDVLSPLANGERPTAGAIDVLDARIGASGRWRRLDPESLTWRRARVDEPDDLVPLLVDDALWIVLEADHSRLGACPACGWLYYDTSRNRSKRWCDMADCGSRDKSRRYYANHRP